VSHHKKVEERETVKILRATIERQSRISLWSTTRIETSVYV